MAYVKLLLDSVYSPNSEEDCLVYEYINSFESNIWKKKGKTSDDSFCVLSAGYLSGWGEGATGKHRLAGEILCTARGDDACRFIRAAPSQLFKMARTYSEKNQLKPHQHIPKFFRNRTNLGEQKESDHKVPYVFFEHNYSNTVRLTKEIKLILKKWLQMNYHYLFDKKRERSLTEYGNNSPRGNHSPTSATKLSRNFEPPVLTHNELLRRALEKFHSFRINPTEGTIELSRERCILIRGSTLSLGIYSLFEDLFGSGEQKIANTFASRFLFEFGRTIALSNHKWFAKEIKLNDNSIELATTLTIILAAFGWADIVFRDGLNCKELQKQKENFRVLCEASNSFEASSWLKLKKDLPIKSPVCFIHSGFLSGWFEASFGTKTVAVETACQAMGQKFCQFLICHENNLRKYVPPHVQSVAIPSPFEDSSNVVLKYGETRNRKLSKNS
eukprot:TRINITY_DN3246_c0_g1_i3.p1 TRINITY_DN3246_c0_g1~~TRINITY_DN3246_c0_g1_i3.p1  ORF type:complete len:520 (-),score=78.52 TRINITY_DN3246_c0_g1_i3:63-1394(-)